MIDQLHISILADGLCDYCGMPYIVTYNEFGTDSELEYYGQCQDCNIADWKYGGPWHERYDNETEISGGKNTITDDKSIESKETK